MKRLLFTIILATVLWTVMFSPWTAHYVNFWWMMTASACVLSLCATIFAPGWWKHVRLTPSNIFWGVVIAVALWGVFWVGDKLSQLMFDFAGRYHLWDERGRVALAAYCAYALSHRPGRGNILARLRAAQSFAPLEPQSRLCCYNACLCAGACRLNELHAHNGCHGGRCRMGSSVPSVPRALRGNNNIACFVGCGGVYLVPDNVNGNIYGKR